MDQDLPAFRAIRVFGGVAELAKVTGRSNSRVHRWTYPLSRGGTGGLIPGGSAMLVKILDAARERNLQLTLEDLVIRGEVP